MRIKLLTLTAFLCAAMLNVKAADADTFTPCKEDEVAQNYDQLWAGYDPRKEPLEVEVLKEWEEDGVVMKVIRYRAFRFKGENAMIAAIYGYPKGAKKLPGLVQCHGGGQFADYRAVLTNAKRGYATISVAWAGRINAPDYKVDSNKRVAYINKEAGALVTTNYGILDGFHAPGTHKQTSSMGFNAYEWTIDQHYSPRNACYFLWVVAGRRAITFLEQQKEVDGDKIGVYGHSMGGKLTVMIAGCDSRVKAAVPSCGGLKDFEVPKDAINYKIKALFSNTIANNSYVDHLSADILWLNPINDFNGFTDNSIETFSSLKSEKAGIVSAPHRSHSDNGDHAVGGPLWFDSKLKGTFKFPDAPKAKLEVKTASKTPTLTVEVDKSKEILGIDVYYTQDGVAPKGKDDRNNRKSRFWHYAKPELKGGKWVAELPLETLDRELWAYAHVEYALKKPVTAAGYGYNIFTAKTFHLSSILEKATPEQLKQAGATTPVKASTVIEDFGENWQKEWFTSTPPDRWSYATHKIYSDLFKAPSKDSKFVFEFISPKANSIVFNFDAYYIVKRFEGSKKVQKIVISREDLKDKKKLSPKDWDHFLTFTMSAMGSVQPQGSKYQRWVGDVEFKSLRWE